MEIRPCGDHLIEHIGGVADGRVVIGVVVQIVVVTGRQPRRPHRCVIGPLVTQHGEPERSQGISRARKRRRRRQDVADEAVLGAPLVEVRRSSRQAVDRYVDVELLGGQHTTATVGNLGHQIADLGLDRGAQCRGRPVVDKDLESNGISRELRREAQLTRGIRTVTHAPVGHRQRRIRRVGAVAER